jgi:hypothetical protein
MARTSPGHEGVDHGPEQGSLVEAHDGNRAERFDRARAIVSGRAHR